jgi:hypothetical protein
MVADDDVDRPVHVGAERLTELRRHGGASELDV